LIVIAGVALSRIPLPMPQVVIPPSLIIGYVYQVQLRVHDDQDVATYAFVIVGFSTFSGTLGVETDRICMESNTYY
jgi:hypothetical protein